MDRELSSEASNKSEKKNLEGKVMRKALDQLPFEILTNIVQFLPTNEGLCDIAFVSTPFFELMIDHLIRKSKNDNQHVDELATKARIRRIDRKLKRVKQNVEVFDALSGFRKDLLLLLHTKESRCSHCLYLSTVNKGKSLLASYGLEDYIEEEKRQRRYTIKWMPDNMFFIRLFIDYLPIIYCYYCSYNLCFYLLCIIIYGLLFFI